MEYKLLKICMMTFILPQIINANENSQKFHDYVNSGSIEKVTQMLAEGKANVNFFNPTTGAHPLYEALNNEDLPMFVHLLKGRSDPNSDNYNVGGVLIADRLVGALNRERYLEAALLHGLDPNSQVLVGVLNKASGPMICKVVKNDLVSSLILLKQYGAKVDVSYDYHPNLFYLALKFRAWQAACYLIDVGVVDAEEIVRSEEWREFYNGAYKGNRYKQYWREKLRGKGSSRQDKSGVPELNEL